ncbi:transmembrane transport protein [Dactylosporangium sp. NPDC005555]|uniref:transmembrane transport protein n=1 Tax=Dactylosporangium sp. NPDC005555 TaxID=3154889 RepID=UPI0033B63040
MIWLTWRQFRVQAIVTAAALAALTVYLLLIGFGSRDAYDTGIVGCTPSECAAALQAFVHDYNAPFGIIGAVLLAIPALAGIFWGAPLVARELEEKTDKLVWNQSVTRRRWLAVKLGLIGLTTAAVAGLLSLLLTWSASRYDQVTGERFAALTFVARNVVPIGYALFAFTLGAVTGMIVRRTLPAMAITLAVFAAVQIAVPNGIRQHIMPPVTETVRLDAAAVSSINGLGFRGEGTGGSIHGYTKPGVWPLVEEMHLYKSDGSAYLIADAKPCMVMGSFEESMACTAGQDLHFTFTYQPGDRYWPFQWIELTAFLVLTLLLTGIGFLWIRRRLN